MKVGKLIKNKIVHWHNLSTSVYFLVEWTPSDFAWRKIYNNWNHNLLIHVLPTSSLLLNSNHFCPIIKLQFQNENSKSLNRRIYSTKTQNTETMFHITHNRSWNIISNLITSHSCIMSKENIINVNK